MVWTFCVELYNRAWIKTGTTKVDWLQHSIMNYTYIDYPHCLVPMLLLGNGPFVLKLASYVPKSASSKAS